MARYSEEELDDMVNSFIKKFRGLTRIRQSDYFNSIVLESKTTGFFEEKLSHLIDAGFNIENFKNAYGKKLFNSLFHYFFSVNEMISILIKLNKKYENNIFKIIHLNKSLLSKPCSADDLNNLLALFTEIFISGFLSKGGNLTILQINDKEEYSKGAPYDVAFSFKDEKFLLPFEIKRRTLEDFEVEDEINNLPRWLEGRFNVKKDIPVVLVLDLSDIFIKEIKRGKTKEGLQIYEEKLTIKKIYRKLTEFFDNKTNHELNPELYNIVSVFIFGVMYGDTGNKKSMNNVIYSLMIENQYHKFQSDKEKIWKIIYNFSKTINQEYKFREVMDDYKE